MKRFWIIWKHSLGSFNKDEGYNERNENAIAILRSIIVLINLVCATLIMANIVHNW
tara:strand:- start:421 stop:588 length:168 start_codon:yes stop_codon:yes gene_type:complete